IIEDLESLERLDISGNPFLCDSGIAKLIFAVEDRYKVAAKEGKEFLFENANDTLCDRPYTLRHQPLLDVDTNELQPYDEKLDTTTPLMTSTTESRVTAAEETTPFTLPDLFVGAKTNDTLFKEEPRREVYDLNKANDPKNAMEQQNGIASANCFWLKDYVHTFYCWIGFSLERNNPYHGKRFSHSPSQPCQHAM
ncbi:hypothetical protein COOONC_28630, partial [Cooperia oncophora]